MQGAVGSEAAIDATNHVQVVTSDGHSPPAAAAAPAAGGSSSSMQGGCEYSAVGGLARKGSQQ